VSGPAATTATPASGRRELTVAVLACAAAGGLALTSSSSTWADVTITRQPPLPPTAELLTGSQAAPLVSACGLLLLAAALAVIAVRGAGRVVVGLLVALAGGVVAWSGVRGLSGQLGVDLADVTSTVGLSGATVTTDASVTWPLLALLAGLLGVLAGALVVVRGRRWPGMSRRYERTTTTSTPTVAPAAAPARRARPESPEDRHQAAWKALDRGDDPTV
jgi:uncharacterized membrane protein (TIGR02234 family)